MITNPNAKRALPTLLAILCVTFLARPVPAQELTPPGLSSLDEFADEIAPIHHYKRSPSYPNVTAKMVTADIGYIRVSSYFDQQCVWQSRDGFESLKNAKAIVFDTRYCDGGSFQYTLAEIEQCLDYGGEVSYQAYIPQENYQTLKDYRCNAGAREVNTTTPGEPSKGPEYESREFNLTGNRLMVVLGDGDTEGGAEMLLACLKDNNRAKFIGTRTRGDAWEWVNVKTKSGREYRIDDARFYSPNGRFIGNGRGGSGGIDPEKGFEVKANKDIVFGSENDNQLKFAVDYLTSELAKQKPRKK